MRKRKTESRKKMKCLQIKDKSPRGTKVEPTYNRGIEAIENENQNG